MLSPRPGLDNATDLRNPWERTEVDVLIPTPAGSDDDDPTGWKTAKALIGFIHDAPPDMAEHHDRYLYGRPRE